jgi:tRNA threonylcarbamoyladenosine biosynthesis protein TsaB
MQKPSEALILGIDTTGPVDSVALARGEHIVASLSLRQPPMSSRPLLRLIDVLCVQAQCALADVTALAVNVGPGAFTGLRIGLATAQGLAVAYGKPLLGCTAFEALLTLVPQWQGALCLVVQARKGEVYAADVVILGFEEGLIGHHAPHGAGRLEGMIDNLLESGHVEGFEEIIERPQFHGFDGRLRGFPSL